MRNAIEAASGKEQSLLSDLAEKATHIKLSYRPDFLDI